MERWLILSLLALLSACGGEEQSARGRLDALCDEFCACVGRSMEPSECRAQCFDSYVVNEFCTRAWLERTVTCWAQTECGEGDIDCAESTRDDSCSREVRDACESTNHCGQGPPSFGDSTCTYAGGDCVLIERCYDAGCGFDSEAADRCIALGGECDVAE